MGDADGKSERSDLPIFPAIAREKTLGAAARGLGPDPADHGAPLARPGRRGRAPSKTRSSTAFANPCH